MVKRIGVLALQGNFEAHHRRLVELGAHPLYIKKLTELSAVCGLVLPGGESTTMLKLMDDEFFTQLKGLIQDGLPTLATCAGLILLAQGVTNPSQRSLGVLDVDVERNSYGRQVDSFIKSLVPWTAAGQLWAGEAIKQFPREAEGIEAVFIRAPRMTRVGASTEVLLQSDTGEPLLIRQRNIVAATFHPEMSSNARCIHQSFLTGFNGVDI